MLKCIRVGRIAALCACVWGGSALTTLRASDVSRGQMIPELTEIEARMLAGEMGAGVQRAMEIVFTLGRIYGAPDLVPVTHVQISGVSYKNLGDAGVEFLERWADEGARVRVPTMLNPMGMEESSWRDMGIPEEFALPQMAVVDAFVRMGVQPTLSCTPYFLPRGMPKRGDHLAWAESSAVVFANSILGAYTNREGGPGALAAAIVGRTSRYGLHLDENRVATHVIRVRARLKSIADYGALGYLVGKAVRDGVPYFEDLAEQLPLLSGDISGGGDAVDRLKTMGAAMAASGSIALYHVAGVTPEAVERGGDLLRDDLPVVEIATLDRAYAFLDRDSDVREIDLVSIGCPHASLGEIHLIADYLRGKSVHTRLWITTSRWVKRLAEEAGLGEVIREAGGKIVADTCTVVAPIETIGVHTMATNAAKAAWYAPAHSGVKVRYGSLEQCLEAAVTGLWPDG